MCVCVCVCVCAYDIKNVCVHVAVHARGVRVEHSLVLSHST